MLSFLACRTSGVWKTTTAPIFFRKLQFLTPFFIAILICLNMTDFSMSQRYLSTRLELYLLYTSQCNTVWALLHHTWATLLPFELRWTLSELRCTLSELRGLSYAAPYLNYAAPPYLSYTLHPLSARPHPLSARPHPLSATLHPDLSYAATYLRYSVP